MKLWIAPSFRSRRAVSNGGLLLSVAYDLISFMTLFLFLETLTNNLINEAVDSTINQISSSSFEWWASFICSLLVALFRDVFGTL